VIVPCGDAPDSAQWRTAPDRGNGEDAFVRGTFGKRPEILAPGGSLEAIETAAGHGADAVYAGVGSLNARVRAANLTEAQLPGVVEFLHDTGTRLYVPLNVPLAPEDRDQAARILAICDATGVDAVILRDPALMRLCRDRFPSLAVHASTQAGIHSVETARRAQDLGCRRVILARECSRNDIAAIRDALPQLELEVFVFGAQCFAVSGLCLMGAATTGRSGNHGACSQACRLPATDEAGRPVGYPFSMKDLDLFADLAELAALGVAAFKIEGRLKSPAWVGCVVDWMRMALDRSQPGLSESELEAFHRDVSVLFSRPRTSGFFHGMTDAADQIDIQAPGHRGCDAGEFGTRKTPEGQMLCFRTPVDLNIRDGLLLEVDAPDLPGGIEFVPISIRELFDEMRRPAMRLPAGRNVEVAVEVRRKIIHVAIHSSDGVRVRYGRVERRIPGPVVAGEIPAPRFDTVEIRPDKVRATMIRGPLRFDGEASIQSQPARGDGLSPAMLSKHFGEATYDLTPGLYVNPSDLKRVRRELISAFEAARIASEVARTQDAVAFLTEDPGPPSRTDADLLAHGPVAISRVTGMKAGVLVVQNGTRFLVEPTASGTIIRVVNDRKAGPEAG
jgi:collagenase-like PrtC family protease